MGKIKFKFTLDNAKKGSYYIGANKGGVGKTSLTVEIASILSNLGFSVLVLDLDSGCGSTKLLCHDKSFDKSMFDLFSDKKLTLDKVCIKSNEDFGEIFIVPGDIRNVQIEKEIVLNNQVSTDTILKRKIEPFRKFFDFILFDTPPTISKLNINALMASDYALVVSRASLLDVSDIIPLIDFIKSIKDDTGHEIKVIGTVLNSIEKTNTNDHKKIISLIENELNENLLSVSIPNDIGVRGCQAEKKPICLTRPNSPAVKCLFQLVESTIFATPVISDKVLERNILKTNPQTLFMEDLH